MGWQDKLDSACKAVIIASGLISFDTLVMRDQGIASNVLNPAPVEDHFYKINAPSVPLEQTPLYRHMQEYQRNDKSKGKSGPKYRIPRWLMPDINPEPVISNQWDLV